jgi:hypothetical protein
MKAVMTELGVIKDDPFVERPRSLQRRIKVF